MQAGEAAANKNAGRGPLTVTEGPRHGDAPELIADGGLIRLDQHGPMCVVVAVSRPLWGATASGLAAQRGRVWKADGEHGTRVSTAFSPPLICTWLHGRPSTATALTVGCALVNVDRPLPPAPFTK